MFGKSKSDQRFFDAFTEHAQNTLEAAKHVSALFKELDNAKDLARAVSEAEHAGDQVTHDTIKHLHETWITPFDRSDIHDLICRMDDVLDLTEAVSERVVLFEIKEGRPGAQEIADVLVQCCEKILRACELLTSMKNARELLDLCVAIGKLENEADSIYRRSIAELFKPGNDPMVVMKWRDVFDSLETATDRCADVANVIEGVVLEYA
jgi:predicted phosphate transport protein (TIGR00153 family)